MSFLDLIWIFFIVNAFIPLVQRKLLDLQRARAFQKLERKRGSRVIGLIHRQETMAILGFPVSRYIDIQDSEEIQRAIQLTDPSVPIDVILHTPGGLVLAAEQIAHALEAHPAKVTVLVPHYAMSGGTLIALAADEILLAPQAVLGPVDPQLSQYPAASIVKVIEQKPIAEIDDKTLILADVSRKALRQVKETVFDLLKKQLPAEQAQEVAETLAGGRWTHDYPIRADEAKALGLPVSTDLPTEVFDLMQLYPQASQRRPSVEYIPIPYGPDDRGSKSPPARDEGRD